MSKDYILENIRSSFNTKAGLVSQIATFEEDSGRALNIENFTDYHHMDIRNIYIRGSFSRLCVVAGVRADFTEPMEEILSKAFARICAIDSRRWISFLLDIFPKVESLNLSSLTERQIRMLNIFQFTIWQKTYEDCGFNSLLYEI